MGQTSHWDHWNYHFDCIASAMGVGFDGFFSTKSTYAQSIDEILIRHFPAASNHHYTPSFPPPQCGKMMKHLKISGKHFSRGFRPLGFRPLGFRVFMPWRFSATLTNFLQIVIRLVVRVEISLKFKVIVLNFCWSWMWTLMPMVNAIGLMRNIRQPRGHIQPMTVSWKCNLSSLSDLIHRR